MKVNKNGSGHVTKMTTMVINTFINLIPQNLKTYDFETLHEAFLNGALQSLYKHDTQLILTYFMGPLVLWFKYFDEAVVL